VREEYAGREVAVSAIGMLLDELRLTPEGCKVLEGVDPAAKRMSWEQLCELLEFAEQHLPDVAKIGVTGIASTAHKFGRRFRLARYLLTLEDTLSFILYPRSPIDFACLHTAVNHVPGRIDVVAYLFDQYQENKTFFTMLQGAAHEFMRMLDLPGGNVSLHTDGRQAHFVFTYEVRNSFVDRVQRFVSGGLYNLGSLLLIRSSYPDLVNGRRLFESQLIERAKIEEQLTRSERAFERRIEQSNDIVAEWDEDGRLLYVSPNLPRLIGASADEVLEGPQKVMHQNDFNRFRAGILQALREQEPVRVDDFRMLNAQRDYRWFEANFSPFDSPDGSRRVLGVLRDVTERRRFLAERQKLDQHLEHAQRLEMVGVLAGGIAHDFNNLLTPILGFADLARLELNDPAKVQLRLDNIGEAAGKASDLVKQLMTYAGTEPAAFVVVDLAQEIKSLRRLFEATIPANVEVQVELDDVALVNGDASQLRQVIMNLLINAADAIGQEQGVIELSIHCSDGLVELSVSDDGCGMDEVTRKRAFEPFYTTKFAGRGLGLSAVQGIVRAHNAELSIETELGQGTKVQMTLQAARDQVVEVVLPSPIAGDAFGRVLLVDDDRRVCEVGKAMLDSMGYDVTLAQDGAQALEMLDDGEFTAMVLDLVMPRMDGREVLATLRERHSQLPVILVSGYSAANMGGKVVTDEYTRFLNKPFRAVELAVALQDMKVASRENIA
jgi:PAS domain S-box-containing protein